jgi:hypothetical protein
LSVIVGFSDTDFPPLEGDPCETGWGKFDSGVAKVLKKELFRQLMPQS